MKEVIKVLNVTGKPIGMPEQVFTAWKKSLELYKDQKEQLRRERLLLTAIEEMQDNDLRDLLSR